MDRESAMRLRPRARLPDWAPIMDMQLVQPNLRSMRSKIIVTSGRQPYGAISELRIGYEAVTYLSADIGDGDASLRGAYGMWVLPDPLSGGVHFICAYPGTTAAIYMSRDEQLGASDIQV